MVTLPCSCASMKLERAPSTELTKASGVTVAMLRAWLPLFQSLPAGHDQAVVVSFSLVSSFAWLGQNSAPQCTGASAACPRDGAGRDFRALLAISAGCTEAASRIGGTTVASTCFSRKLRASASISSLVERAFVGGVRVLGWDYTAIAPILGPVSSSVPASIAAVQRAWMFASWDS